MFAIFALGARPARERGIAVVCGVSQQLPFTDASFSLLWFHLSLHYGDWSRALDEAVRVTERGGRIEIWTLADDHHDSSMLARWFPSVVAIDEERFPPCADVEHHLANSASVTRTHVVEERHRTAEEWADAVDAGFVSTLQLVGEDELTGGLARFRAAHPDPRQDIVYELRFDRVVARF